MFFFVMKGISVLLFLLVLISCKSAISDQEVFLFNDISFNLRNNEKIVGLDKKNVAIFDSCFLNRKIQLPLFKCIKNDDYSLYLALPLDASIKELSEIEMHGRFENDSFSTDTSTYFYAEEKSNNEKVLIYTQQFQKNLIYLLVHSKSTSLSDTLFSIDNLKKRFKVHS